MAQSLFKLLKEQEAGVIIDVLAPAWTKPLLARMPEVNDAIALPLTHGEFGLAVRWRLGRDLRSRRYDRAIVLPNSWKSALVPLAAHARQRTGFVGEMRFGLLNDARPLDKDALPRTVDRFAALGLPKNAALPALPFPCLIPQDPTSALARLQLVPDRPILALCPGAEYGSAKRWPAAHFAELARIKLQQGWQVWLFGSHKDAAATAQVQAMTQDTCQDLAGRTSLGEAIDLLALAAAVVTNDSGLMHVAAALSRPVVALFGSSDPDHTPPLSDHALSLSLRLSCSPCFKRECPLGHLRCLNDLRPDRALQALDNVLD